MWIFTVNGFFTVIQDNKDANFVWLRARLREDIERNFPGITAEEHPGADYLYRVKLPREQVAQRLFELAMENNVTSHFKDVMIRTASKPEFGSRSNMLYGVWNAGAAMQPIPPYSKTPRTAFKSTGSTWKPGDRTVGAGQRSLEPYNYGGTGSGRRGSEFDWDANAWGGGGSSQRDPVFSGAPEASDDELDEWWASLSDDDRDAYLDEAERTQRSVEAVESGVTLVDVAPSPYNRTGNRRSRRKDRKSRRANRHNQDQHSGHGMTDAEYARYSQERRDGKHGKEQQNRQAFIDSQRQQKGAKA